jgi:ribonuclease P protein component
MARFTRQRRLSSAAEFDRVFRDGHRSADQLFTVLYRSNGLGYPRVGLALAKRRIRRAVDRNRLKRLIRESFRAATATLPAADIVVLARNGAATADGAAVAASLERHWRAVGAGTADAAGRPALN